MEFKGQKILTEVFGISSLREIQKKIISCVLEGRDALVILPTGSGKSLCYQLPALMLDGMTVVFSPLIALMQDQVAALRKKGVAAEVLNSSLSAEEQARVRKEALAGRIKLLYIAPERLARAGSLDFLSRCPISLFAIDEAHCVCSWGHDFRPDYRRLEQLKELFPSVPRMALTATADRLNQKDIADRFLENPERFISSKGRENLRYTVVRGRRIQELLAKFIESSHRGESGIVYVNSRSRAESLSAFLRKRGHRARPYHAGMSAEERDACQREFIESSSLIVVATVAFGMGINKPNVRFVAHTCLPDSLERFVQESGRAGRDGKRADCWLGYNGGDIFLLRKRIEESESEEWFKNLCSTKLEVMLAFAESFEDKESLLRFQFLAPEASEDEKNLATVSERNFSACIKPGVPFWDASTASRKLLSTIWRIWKKTSKFFPARVLINVLQGIRSAVCDQYDLSSVTTWGIGTDAAAGQWEQVIRHMLLKGYLTADFTRQNALLLTKEGAEFLKSDKKLLLPK